jgi:hypothetical protein
MDKETLRMQMLAGIITESQYAVKLKEMEGDPEGYYGYQEPIDPNDYAEPNSGDTPEWIDPNSPEAKILTDVYYIGDGARGDLSPLRGSAVPSYELEGYSMEDIQDMGDGHLYIENGEKGWYDEKNGMFESADENSTTRIEKKYIKFL